MTERPIYPHAAGAIRPAALDYNVTPLVVIWEITRACPLACVHCRADANVRRHPLELNTEEGYRLMDQVKELGAPVFVLTGGDPLMRKDFFDLVRYGTSIGLRVSASPSATRLVTPDSMAKARAAGLMRVAISLDGASPEVHDAFRGVPGSYEMTMDCVRYAKDAGLEVQIGTTVTRRNVQDLPRMVEQLNGMDISLWNAFFLVPVGRAQADECLSAEEHEQVLQWLHETTARVPFPIKTTEAPHYRRIAQALGTKIPGNGVGDGKGFVFVSHIGEIQPSGFFPLTAGDIRKESIADVYRHSPLFQALRDPNQLKGKCGVCEFRATCSGSRARAWSMTGDYLESDPFCAYIPKASVTA